MTGVTIESLIIAPKMSPLWPGYHKLVDSDPVIIFKGYLRGQFYIAIICGEPNNRLT